MRSSQCENASAAVRRNWESPLETIRRLGTRLGFFQKPGGPANLPPALDPLSLSVGHARPATSVRRDSSASTTWRIHFDGSVPGSTLRGTQFRRKGGGSAAPNTMGIRTLCGSDQTSVRAACHSGRFVFRGPHGGNSSGLSGCAMQARPVYTFVWPGQAKACPTAG
jgi:hypothetical protein